MAQEKASLSRVKREIRRRKKKHPEHGHEGINIYPMMDMMTILLVFMVMQFAQQSSSITSSEELKLPYSTSQVDVDQSVPLQISTKAIVLQDQTVVNLKPDGTIDSSDKKGGSKGFLVVPLYRELDRIRDQKKQLQARNPKLVFEGNVQIIADKRTKFRTLSEVIYTLGQTEFKKLHFLSDTQGAHE